MGLTLHPNAILTLAAFLTAGVGLLFCLPLPPGPDRAQMGFACFLLQTPRWIGLVLVLGLCVARGAFSWPSSRGIQFLILFLVQAALGVGAICAGLCGLCVTPGIPAWLSRTLAASTVVVPSMQIVFAAWYLNPEWRQGADAT